MNLKNLLMLFIASIISVNVNVYAEIYEVEPDVNNCTRGKFSQEGKNQIIKLINDIRARHKIAPIPWNEQGEIFAQAAALSIAATGIISHGAVSGKCSDANSNTGREESNLSIVRSSSPGLHTTYEEHIIGWLIDDDNVSTLSGVGHRRFIINPYAKSASYGQVVDAPHPTSSGSIGAAAFWGITADNMGPSACENDFIAYPYENYPPAWVNKSFYLSFTPLIDNTFYPFTPCDFSKARITMKDEQENNITVNSIAYDYQAGGGLRNNISWLAVGLRDSVKYTITIDSILIGGNARKYEYWFKLTDESVVPLAEVPTLVSPANNSQNIEAPVTFVWNKAENAEYYSIQGSLTSNFMNIAFEANKLEDTTYTLTEPLTSNSVYYWRIAAYNIDSVSSEYSEIWTFKSKEILFASPVLIYPEANNEDIARRDEYVWNSVDGVDYYNLQIARTSDFSATSIVVEQKEINDTTYYLTETQMLDEFTNYYWRVNATLLSGNNTDWAIPIQYKTNDMISSIVTFENGTTVTCYSNPFANQTTIFINSSTNTFVNIEIFNMLGAKVIDLYSGNLEFGMNEFKFESEYLTKGVYFLKILLDGNIVVEKIVID